MEKSPQQETGGRTWLQTTNPDMDHAALTAAGAHKHWIAAATGDIPVSCNMSQATGTEPASLLSPAKHFVAQLGLSVCLAPELRHVLVTHT